MVLGILAHVDAGKTTLSEALLYETGKIKTPGRVDHKDAYLDTDAQERERGITIFSKQARMCYEGVEFTLLDTPGHVDFSAEMERALQVLDYAILVISGTDGVQGHTRTLWRLLEHYQIPTFFFVNKMDLDGADEAKIQSELREKLSVNCVDFMPWAKDKSTTEWQEEVATSSEELLETYMETGDLNQEAVACAIGQRHLFPCFYGSALKVEGVDFLLRGLTTYACGDPDGTGMEDGTGKDGAMKDGIGESAAGVEKMIKRKLEPPFGALVYKIGRDAKGTRLTHIKVTSGVLRVRDRIAYESRGMEYEEKADQLRLYSGDRFETATEVAAGEICAVTGWTATYPGMGLGVDATVTMPILEPVLNYRILVPQGVSPLLLMQDLKQLEEEDPQLNILWNESLQEIHAQLMGQVQMEVLQRVIEDRFGVRVGFDTGSIVYRETIAAAVEGVGHYEPLRHYAEVHLYMEPGEPGSGIAVESDCSEDVLDLNWQRLIETHILEREHPGVLTGAALCDVKFTIVTGRAHLKHTEGGDFRQATYRAIRQGLKSTESVLLEPMYGFTLEVPAAQLGRAMTDIQNRFGKHEAPEYRMVAEEEMAILTGAAPVSTMQDYVQEVHSYTRGLGRLTLELKGYDVCHNSAEVVERLAYDSEADVANPTGSVFCSHGAGFVVPWNEVPAFMHLPYVRDCTKGQEQTDGLAYDLETQAEQLRELARRREEERSGAQSASSWELDQQLQEIYVREFGLSKEEVLDGGRRKWRKENTDQRPVCRTKLDKKGNPIYPKKPKKEELLIVDGYNIIFAWEELKELSKVNIDSAKDKFKDLLVNYQGYRGQRVLLVFDGYRRKGNPGSKETYFGLEVVHTRQDETADAFIERTVHESVPKYEVTVATSDRLEQLTVLSQGALRMSARELQMELEREGKNHEL